MSALWKWFKKTFLAQGGDSSNTAATYERHQNEEDEQDLDGDHQQAAGSDVPGQLQDSWQESAKTPRPAHIESLVADKQLTPGAHTPLMHSCSWQDQLRTSSAELDLNNKSRRAEWDGIVDSPDSYTLSSRSSPDHCDLDIHDQQQYEHRSSLLKSAEPSWAAGTAVDQLVTPPHAVTNGRFVLSDDGQTAGIANTVTKYLPTRAVVPHATPFDLRVDQALALERRQQGASANDESAPLRWAGFATKSDQ